MALRRDRQCALLGDFYEERVVAYEADDAILVIECIFTEHFSCGDGFEGRKLVENVFNCCRCGGHNFKPCHSDLFSSRFC